MYNGTIQTGSSVSEVIEAPGDLDLYSVDLVGGVDYVTSVLGASTAGGSLADPAVAVWDSAFNLLAFNDDSFALGLDPMLQFSAPANGTYYIGVTDLFGGTGDYTLVADQAGPPIWFGSMPGEGFIA
jgi:Bacterial pre-peptidase C-terminal domain